MHMKELLQGFLLTVAFSLLAMQSTQAQSFTSPRQESINSLAQHLQYDLSLNEYNVDSFRSILTKWYNAQDAATSTIMPLDSLYFKKYQFYNIYSSRLNRVISPYQVKALNAGFYKLVQANRFTLPDRDVNTSLSPMTDDEAEDLFKRMELKESQLAVIRKNLSACYVERSVAVEATHDTAWAEARCYAMRDSYETKSLKILSPFQQSLFLELQKGDRLNVIIPTIPSSQ